MLKGTIDSYRTLECSLGTRVSVPVKKDSTTKWSRCGKEIQHMSTTLNSCMDKDE
jgi:hypothetical protein